MKGLTAPPVLPERLTPEGALRRGTVLLCLGIGLGVAAAIAATVIEQGFGGILAGVAAIVGFLGVGHLAYYFVARHRPATLDCETPQAT